MEEMVTALLVPIQIRDINRRMLLGILEFYFCQVDMGDLCVFCCCSVIVVVVRSFEIIHREGTFGFRQSVLCYGLTVTINWLTLLRSRKFFNVKTEDNYSIPLACLFSLNYHQTSTSIAVAYFRLT